MTLQPKALHQLGKGAHIDARWHQREDSILRDPHILCGFKPSFLAACCVPDHEEMRQPNLVLSHKRQCCQGGEPANCDGLCRKLLSSQAITAAPTHLNPTACRNYLWRQSRQLFPWPEQKPEWKGSIARILQEALELFCCHTLSYLTQERKIWNWAVIGWIRRILQWCPQEQCDHCLL